MTHTLDDYLDFIFSHGEEKKSEESKRAVFMVPPILGNEKTSSRKIWLNDEDFLEALTILLRAAKALTSQQPKKSVAKYILHSLEDGEGEDLRQACLDFVKVHGNTKGPFTFYHKDGRQMTGTYKELEALTGIHYSRVTDMVLGKRDYALGWATTPARAAMGKKKTGPKPKRRLEVTEGTSLW